MRGGPTIHRPSRFHIVDRTTGLFNDRFVRPVLEDELARAHRYQRNLGVLLIEVNGSLPPDEH